MDRLVKKYPSIKNHKWHYGFGPDALLMPLIKAPNHSLPLKELHRLLNPPNKKHDDIPYMEVEILAVSLPNLVTVKEGSQVIVTYAPTLQLCSDYVLAKCDDKCCACLHICPHFILDHCNDDQCGLSHYYYDTLIRIPDKHLNKTLDRGISNRILMKYYALDLFKRTPYINFFGRQARALARKHEFDICLNYNEYKCKDADCPYIHLCIPFLAGICTNPEFEEALKSKIGRHPCKLEHKNIGPGFNWVEGTIEINLLSRFFRKHKRAGTTILKFLKEVYDHKNRLKTMILPSIQSTVRAEYPYGDVAIPEICSRQHVECLEEITVCFRLHSTRNFHWQVQRQDLMWLNFRPNQVVELEKLYTDPLNMIVDLPEIKENELLDPGAELKRLLSNYRWKVNFKTFKCISSSTELSIRRLTSEPTSNPKKSNMYTWYHEIKNEWARLPSDLDEKYRKCPYGYAIIESGNHELFIDFLTMTETNFKLEWVRDIIKRPLYCDEVRSKNYTLEINIQNPPKHWTPMGNNRLPYKIQQLRDSDAEEREEVLAVFAKHKLFSKIKNMVQAICRIQCVLGYQNFIQNVETRGSKGEMMYYQADISTVNSIARANIDCNLTKPTYKTKLGPGTYFTSSLTRAIKWALDSKDREFVCIVMAKVLVDNQTVYSRNITRYKSSDTVINKEGGEVFIKFDKREYCPEYVLIIAKPTINMSQSSEQNQSSKQIQSSETKASAKPIKSPEAKTSSKPNQSSNPNQSSKPMQTKASSKPIQSPETKTSSRPNPSLEQIQSPEPKKSSKKKKSKSKKSS